MAINSKSLQSRAAAYTMSSCHSSTIHACAKWTDVIAMPAMPAHKDNLHPIALLQPAPLKCVPTPARLSIHCACVQEQFALFCRASASALKCVLKLQRINQTTVVYSCSYSWFRSVYHWWWATLDCCCRVGQYNDNLKRSAGKIQSIREWQPFSPRAAWYTWCGQVQINVVPWDPWTWRLKLTYQRMHNTP